jgi:hypothetical protein
MYLRGADTQHRALASGHASDPRKHDHLIKFSLIHLITCFSGWLEPRGFLTSIEPPNFTKLHI